MKKNFKLTSENKAPARQVDAVKHEIKKYIARERRKTLNSDTDFWDFDCKFGDSCELALSLSHLDINKAIDKTVADGKVEFYIEIFARAAKKIKQK